MVNFLNHPKKGGMAPSPKEQQAAIIRNLKDKTGRNLDEWIEQMKGSGAHRPKEQMEWLKKSQGLGPTTFPGRHHPAGLPGRCLRRFPQHLRPWVVNLAVPWMHGASERNTGPAPDTGRHALPVFYRLQHFHAIALGDVLEGDRLRHPGLCGTDPGGHAVTYRTGADPMAMLLPGRVPHHSPAGMDGATSLDTRRRCLTGTQWHSVRK